MVNWLPFDQSKSYAALLECQKHNQIPPTLSKLLITKYAKTSTIVYNTVCWHNTLIQFAKFSAKNLLMAKLLQNYSNLNDLEYSRHLMARKVEKRPKIFLKAKQRPEVEKPKFS